MYLTTREYLWQKHTVFTHTDPRADGCTGRVTEGVELDYDMNAIHRWPPGEPHPEPQLGRDPQNARQYKVFKYPGELHAAGYELVAEGAPFVAYSWRDYLQMFPTPADIAKRSDPAVWFEYLDEVDEANRQLRQEHQPEPLPDSGPDVVAEWVAKNHLSTDGSLRRIVYLPTGAPVNEIRLLALSERVVSEELPLKPFTFAAHVANRTFKVSVVDVTGHLFRRIQAQPELLPTGWTLEASRSWGRLHD